MCREIMEAEDWSACGEDFKLAVEVLTKNFGLAADIMRQIGKNGILREVHYREWPLFKEFRKSEEFLKAFKEIYRCEFAELEVVKSIYT